MGGKERRPAKVFDFRAELRRKKRQRSRSSLAYIAAGLLGGTALGFGFITWPSASASLAATESSPEFAVCGMIRRTCVVDGDTIWLEGVKIRMADIDTPEISEPKCNWEYEQGIKARDRLVVLLNEGPFDVVPIGDRDEDSYGRKLRVLARSGHSIGDRLVSEGLARAWTGRREPWC